MTQAFVTGATGFLGRNLLEKLTDAGWRVTGLHRSAEPPADWQRLGVVPARGEITDRASLQAAMPEGVDAVFHLAADTTPWRGARARQEAVNLGGTDAVIEAAKARRAGRLVHVLTCAVWGHQAGLVDESMSQHGRTSWVGYVRTKALAEDGVRAAVRDGLDGVIVNPAHIIGRYDAGNWAQLFFLIARDALPGVPPGGGCFANAGDVAGALIAAAESGRSGENYILGGPHASFLEVVQEIARLLDKPQPRRVTPAPVLKTMARLGDFKSRLTGKRPNITPEAADFICRDERVSSRKAEDALGYRQTPLAQSLGQCHAWLAETGRLVPPES